MERCRTFKPTPQMLVIAHGRLVPRRARLRRTPPPPMFGHERGPYSLTQPPQVPLRGVNRLSASRCWLLASFVLEDLGEDPESLAPFNHNLEQWLSYLSVPNPGYLTQIRE